MTLPYDFGSATTPDHNFFKQLQEDLVFLDSGAGGVTLVNQALIDATDDGGTIIVAGNGVIEEITIDSKRIHFIIRPDGDTIDLLGTITYENCSYCIWKGNNHNIGWLGNDTDPMFKLSHCQYLYFGQTIFSSSQFDPCVAGFWLMSSTSGQVMTQCIFEDIRIDGTAQTGLQYGWRIGVEGDSNGFNNDFHRFIRCTVQNFDICGYSIEQPQAINQTLADSGFGGSGFGQYGVSTALNAGGGSFFLSGGGGGGTSIADFYLGASNAPIVIQGSQLESSNRVLITDTSASSWPVHLRDCRIATDELNADGEVIIYSQRGPFILSNNTIGNESVLDVAVKLNASGPTQGIAISNHIDSNFDNPFTVNNEGDGQWLLYGNNTGETDPNPLPMSIPVLVFGQLPVDNVKRGYMVHLTDTNTTTPGDAIVSGGGAGNVLAWFNGTDWKVVGS